MTTLMVLIRDESVDNPNPKIILGHSPQGTPNPKIITRTAKLDWITFPVAMVCLHSSSSSSWKHSSCVHLFTLLALVFKRLGGIICPSKTFYCADTQTSMRCADELLWRCMSSVCSATMKVCELFCCDLEPNRYVKYSADKK